jgi:hypothetical protein
MAAAEEAVRHAGLAPETLRDAAVSIGGAGGGMLEAEAWYCDYFHGEENPRLRGALRTMLPASQTDVARRSRPHHALPTLAWYSAASSPGSHGRAHDRRGR